MSCIILKVEVRAGTDITQACKDAIDLADKLGITIHFEFNGIKLWAKANSSVYKLERDYEKLAYPTKL